MDSIYENPFQFWAYLNRCNVNYIMVGDFAAHLHGFNNLTNYWEIWIEDTIYNRQNLTDAFKTSGYGNFSNLEQMQFVSGWTNFHIENGIILNIATDIKGLEGMTFQECFERASTADFDGIILPFLHIDHLIINKKTVNRPKDQIALIALERIKKNREEE